MLSPDDHSGIFSFLVGIVVIVMTAVGLSMLVDQRFRFSSGSGEMRREIASKESELAKLRASLASRKSRLTGEGKSREQASQGLGKAQAMIEAIHKKKEDLLAARAMIRDRIDAMDSEFAIYREDFRTKARATAAGETVGNLRVRGGREYLDATITKVTDVGLEIRHSDGFARIHAPDLDASWHERFLWSDEERRARLKEEMKNREALSVARSDDEVGKSPVRAPREVASAMAAGLEDLRLLRTQVSGWQSKVARLETERAEASSNAAYGSSNSVPGSLETWKSRAARLERELARGRIELSLASGKLAAVSPGDPLLVTGESGGR